MAQVTLKEDVPSALELRDMLEEMAVRELRGPVQGEEEEVPGRIRDRYLVGILAPRQRAEGMPLPLFDKPATPPAEDDDNLEGDFPPGDDMAVEGSGRGNLGGDDGPTERSPSMSKAVFPSSLGLSFCVPLDVTALKVTPRWGRYDKAPSAFLTNPKTGTPKRVWKRQPCGTSHEIPLQAGPVGPLIADEAFPDAKVKGLIRRRADHWSVTLFLVNDGIEPPPPNRERTWMFQCELAVEAPDGSPVFHKRFTRIDLTGTDEAYKQEAEMLAMLYRRHVEFAVGHGDRPSTPTWTRRTRTGPSGSRPRVDPQLRGPQDHPADRRGRRPEPRLRQAGRAGPGHEAPGRDARRPASPQAGAAGRGLPGVDRAGEGEDRRPRRGPGPFQARWRGRPSSGAETTLKRIEEGLDLLATDEQAAEAFRFMNQAMWLQRTHSLFSERRPAGPGHRLDNDIDVPANRSWYPFQLAFILLNLPGITRLDHPDRSESADAVADLLWFPTGGGKTEAYLGLTAYTMAPAAAARHGRGRSGENGVAVLMRYTLRLLTIQQFQRATALICACEVDPPQGLEQGDDRWGKDAVPHRPVGRPAAPRPTRPTTPPRRSSRRTAATSTAASAAVGSPAPTDQLPLVRQRRSSPASTSRSRPYSQGPGRTLDLLRRQVRPVPVQPSGSRRDEGLPVVVVDEEIYRRLPTLLIATVDKFAQMPWKGEVADALRPGRRATASGTGSGRPRSRTPAVHPKTRTASSPPATTRSRPRPLRPPDLIIQDELHLISGPLGHAGRPVRDGHRPALLLGGRTARRSGPR